MVGDHSFSWAILLRLRWTFTALIASCGLFSSAVGADPLPTVAELLDGTPFSKRDAAAVLAGDIAITSVDESSKRELVIGLACLMSNDAPQPTTFDSFQPMLPAKLVAYFGVIDANDGSAGLETLRMRSVEKKELRRYVEFEPGLGLNMSSNEREAWQKLASEHGGEPSQEQLDEELERLMALRLASYRSKGLAGIPPYLRKDGKVAQPGQEMRRSLESAHAVEQRAPEFVQFWNDYPNAELDGALERFFWLQSTIRDRPVIMLGHQVAWQRGDIRMVGERHFYVSHFFNGGQTVALMIPAREGTLFAVMERLWIDGYSGMARMKRSLGRKMLARNLRDEVLHREACGQE